MGYSDTESFIAHSIGVQLRFSWLPTKCALSGKSIWFKNAYRHTAMYTGPGDPVFEHRWYDQHEYVIAKLKGVL